MTTMHEQLTALLRFCQDPMIEFQVIPFAAGLHEAVELSAITIFRFPPPDVEVVAIEQVRFVEFLDKRSTIEKYNSIFAGLPDY